jgi:hypothetical protein
MIRRIFAVVGAILGSAAWAMNVKGMMFEIYRIVVGKAID